VGVSSFQFRIVLTKGGNMVTQFKDSLWKASLLATTMSLLAFTIALAAPGDLDPTFSGDGRVIADISGGSFDSIGGISIFPSGRIIVAATSNDNFAVIRYLSNGTLDSTFSSDGKVLTDFGGSEGTEDVAIQSNGRIVVTGTSCLTGGWPDGDCDVVVARYNPNGTLDTTFSGDGRLRTDLGGRTNGTWSGLAVQSNGKLVVAGYMHNGTNFDFAVYRYDANGALDVTFSGDGRVNIGFGSGPEDLATDLVLQSNGKIVVGGVSCDVVGLLPWENCDFAVVRLNPNGSLDTTFSGDGRQVVNFGGVDLPDGIALQSDGKVVLAGYKEGPTESYFAVARLTTDGTLDTTFRGIGRVVTSFGAGSGAHGRDVRIQSDGKIIVIGHANGNFAVARYNTDGTLDATFSGDGLMMVNFGFDDIGWVIALQSSDGKYVLAGRRDNGTQSDIALARVLP
jgi:uncharacterized delta-60 repeat protein